MAPKRLLLITGLFTALGLPGCTVEPEPEGPPPPRVVEVAPYGYAYGPTYYENGYYRDGYWYWHDRDRWYREAREDHERRMHDYHDHEHFEHEHR